MIAGSTAFGVKLVFINVTIVTVSVATGWQSYCSGYLVSSRVKSKEKRLHCKTATILRLLEGSVGEVLFAFTITSVLLCAMAVVFTLDPHKHTMKCFILVEVKTFQALKDLEE